MSDPSAFAQAVEDAAREHLGLTLTRWVMPYLGYDDEGELHSGIHSAPNQVIIDTLGLIEYAAVNTREKVKQ